MYYDPQVSVYGDARSDDSTSLPVSFGQASYLASPFCWGNVVELITGTRERVRTGPVLADNIQGIADMLALNSHRTLPEGTQKAKECWSRPCPGGRVPRTCCVKAVATRVASSVLRDVELS